MEKMRYSFAAGLAAFPEVVAASSEWVDCPAGLSSADFCSFDASFADFDWKTVGKLAEIRRASAGYPMGFAHFEVAGEQLYNVVAEPSFVAGTYWAAKTKRK